MGEYKVFSIYYFICGRCFCLCNDNGLLEVSPEENVLSGRVINLDREVTVHLLFVGKDMYEV